MRKIAAMLLVSPLALAAASPLHAQGVLEAAPIQSQSGAMVTTAPPEPGDFAAAGVAGGDYQGDPYEYLYETMLGTIDNDTLIDGKLDLVMQDMVRQAPKLLDYERIHPGLIADLREAIRPVMTEFVLRKREA